MSSIFRIAALAAIALVPVHAGAEQAADAPSKLSPVCLDVVHLGSVSAMTYYIEEQEGFRVVTTIQHDDSDTAAPVRFVSILQPGQRAVVSVPAQLGEEAWTLEFVREGDRLVAHHPNARSATELRATTPTLE